jgi:hypothetical protein
MREHIVSLSHEDREFIRRLMALTQDLAAAALALASAVDGLSARIGGGPAAGFSVSDANVQSAVDAVNAQTARLNALLPAGNPPGAPAISNVSPASAPVGTQITITGSGFGASAGSSTVKFNGLATTPDANSKWSDTQITIDVPSGATTGNLIVNVNGVDSNALAFTVA